MNWRRLPVATALAALEELNGNLPASDQVAIGDVRAITCDGRGTILFEFGGAEAAAAATALWNGSVWVFVRAGGAIEIVEYREGREVFRLPKPLGDPAAN